MSEMFRLPDGRALACSDIGPRQASDLLLCLPGLLETRQTFAPVLHALQQAAPQHAGLRVISVDHCGRGESDPLPGDQGYSMARYLDDVTLCAQHHLQASGAQRLHVLGTSMGGILGMYLAANTALPVQTLILNDVGLSFYWVSIYGLYDGMQKGMGSMRPEDIAAELHVTLGALRAVQSPSHFDLPYRRDWKGMKFGHLLQHFQGEVRLVHGGASGVCLADQVRELRGQFPHARVFEVPDAKHPAPFTTDVCAFVLAGLTPATVPETMAPEVVLDESSVDQSSLREAASVLVDAVTNQPASAVEARPEQLALLPASEPIRTPELLPPDGTSQASVTKLASATEPGFWAWLKRRVMRREGNNSFDAKSTE
jgi:pimeloyl-ACP methyl ester carboxylesterase